MTDSIKAILFDSGRVLNKPVTGHWFITPNFFKFVDKKKFHSIPKAKLNNVFKEAGSYISSLNYIRTEEEEFKGFFEYYKIFSEKLPELGLNDEKIECITKDLVFNYDKYEFFKDVSKTLEDLRKKYRLAIVSDAWPSLENVYKKAELRNYFSSFVISSQIGVTKPNELMYKTALEELRVAPEEALFIDDNYKNCEGAKKLGIRTILICRGLGYYIYYKLMCRDHKVVRNLKHLKI